MESDLNNATVSQRISAGKTFVRLRRSIAVIVVFRLGTFVLRRVADGRHGRRRQAAGSRAAPARRGSRRPAAAERFGLLQPFLLLHSAVLKPDFHLRLIESERGGDLDAPRARQVAIEVEFLLELSQLLVGEVGAAAVRRSGQLRMWLTGVDAVVEHRPRHCIHQYMYMHGVRIIHHIR